MTVLQTCLSVLANYSNLRVNGSLTGISGSGDNISYEYLSDGKRLSKDVNGSKTIYIYNNGNLLCEETSSDKINYYYDSQGNVKEIGYQTKSGTTLSTETYYFFARNGQGDIIAVYRNSDSKLIGTYEYDLWGNLVSAEQATDSRTGAILDTNNILYRNPLRYRGYYYDAETGFYYLNARYYDSVTHRFISPDVLIAGTPKDVVGYNLYEYCNNNPVIYMDHTGFWPKVTLGGGGTGSLMFGEVGLQGAIMILLDDEWNLDVQIGGGLCFGIGVDSAGELGLAIFPGKLAEETAGYYASLGGSAGILGHTRVDLLTAGEGGEIEIVGVGFGKGVGVGAEVHGSEGIMITIWHINLKDHISDKIEKIRKKK